MLCEFFTAVNNVMCGSLQLYKMLCGVVYSCTLCYVGYFTAVDNAMYGGLQLYIMLCASLQLYIMLCVVVYRWI